METISLGDGLVLTIVSIALVFLVLAMIGVLTDYVAKVVHREEPISPEDAVEAEPAVSTTARETGLSPANPENQFVAEMTALVLASENQPDRKFEVVESKKIR